MVVAEVISGGVVEVGVDAASWVNFDASGVEATSWIDPDGSGLSCCAVDAGGAIDVSEVGEKEVDERFVVAVST